MKKKHTADAKLRVESNADKERLKADRDEKNFCVQRLKFPAVREKS